jgi:glycosyltransferase involved in cell wall biosynthesis
MKILLVHNHYQQRGGEDQVFQDESDLLKHYGHEVLQYTRHNDALKQMGRLAAARRTVWNAQVYRELRSLIRRERPVLMHCTNTFPLISRAAYSAAKAEGVAVVQSLHNYRLICPKATLMRDGKVCEDCIGRAVAWPAIKHACYRDSRPATATLVGMLATHRLLGTLHRKVDRFIALTEFGRNKFVQAGLPAERIAVKPNFVDPDLGFAEGDGGYAVFVGRLSTEKGIDTLLNAWKQNPALPLLKIVGDGPLADVVRAASAEHDHITWLGSRSPVETQQIMGNATMLVFPSIWYEGLPKTIVEAFSRGTPVVASRLGVMEELIDHDRTGVLFEPGNSAALTDAVSKLARDSVRLAKMRTQARKEFELHYTADRNYQSLMNIYADALRHQGNLDAANMMTACITETSQPKQESAFCVEQIPQELCHIAEEQVVS